MKKIVYISLLLFIFFIQSNVFALTTNAISITCEKSTLSLGETSNCYIQGKATNNNVIEINFSEPIIGTAYLN